MPGPSDAGAIRSRAFRSIAADCSSIWERLRSDWTATGARPDLVELRLRTWADGIAAGDLAALERRLAVEGLGLTDVARVLGPGRFSPGTPLPPWIATLERIVDAAAYDGGARSSTPFSEVLRPLGELAGRMLEDVAGGAAVAFSAHALRGMQTRLIQQLSALCTPAIASEMALARYLGGLDGASPEQRHQGFLRTHLGSPESFLRFLTGYPVLGRLIAERVDHWVDATAEFIVRAARDADVIRSVFSAASPLGAIVDVHDGFSDSHHRGRSVKIVRFEAGVQVVYKPRPLGVDVAFGRLLERLNAEISVPLRTCRVIDRSTHGWVEYVEQAPCSDDRGAVDYYRRTGTLLALLYALGGSDAHFENVIASGDHPVLVDTEMVLGLPALPARDAAGTGEADRIAGQALQRSVLNVGLLPRWLFGALDRPGVDGGGISAEPGQRSPWGRTSWSGIASDTIVSGVDYPQIRQQSNQPVRSGRAVPANAHADDVASGFEETYRLILARGSAWCEAEDLRALCRQRVRYLHRPTREYSLILERTLDVASLRDGAHRSLRIELLARRVMTDGQQQDWRLLPAEREALERLDIPRFDAAGDGRAIDAGNGVTLEGYFEHTALDALRARLSMLSDEDLSAQVGWLRAALMARSQESPHADPAASAWQPPARAVMPGRDLLALAADIGHALVRESIRGKDGTVTWLGLEFLPNAGQHQVQVLGAGLYGGLAGMALLFAALERFVPSAGVGFGEQALMTINSLRSRRLATRADVLKRQCGIGGLSGITSVAYALAWAGRLLDSKSAMLEAHAWAATLSADDIRGCRSHDFLTGVAGTIPALLRLHAWSGNERMFDLASVGAEHLVGGALPKETWPGVAHGRAGIAYALVRMSSAAANEQWRATGQAAFDAGDTDPARANDGWCRGRPGLALVKLASADLLDRPVMTGELRSELDAIAAHGVKGADTLCCGICGRADVLITAGRKSGNSSWIDAAADDMSGMAQRAHARGRFELLRGDGALRQPPGLFKGLAGIAYTCLRLADPDGHLPSVLLLE
ncbi:MAG: type 2 lanthipeptide synthetase LanM [Vicinamibacterales bacterium]